MAFVSIGSLLGLLAIVWTSIVTKRYFDEIVAENEATSVPNQEGDLEGSGQNEENASEEVAQKLRSPEEQLDKFVNSHRQMIEENTRLLGDD